MDQSLLRLVLRRLGFDGEPSANLDGLNAVYRAWCAGVPFDNVRKMIALRSAHGGPLPGGCADDFFQAWLAHGAGGTCWPTSNALFELLRSLGFPARRISGYMRDLGILNHASVKVALDGHEWLVDSSALTNDPLPLGDRVLIREDPVFSAEVEPDGSTHVVWTAPANSGPLPCRLNHEPVTHEFYLSRYEDSRERSPFNQRLYARVNRPGEILVLLGNTRFSKTASGVASRDLSRDELCESLRRDIGLSVDLIDQWVRSGGLADSFQPPSGPKPPSLTRKPPSQRQAGAAMR